MSQFDVYANRGPNSDTIPFLLDVQSDLLAPLRTRVVVPLVAVEAARPMTRLNPVFRVGGRDVLMSTQEIAGYPIERLIEPVGTLAPRRDEIVAAIDFLIQGF